MSTVSWLAIVASLPLAVVCFFAYAHIKYAKIIGRIFEEKPLLLPLRVKPTTDGEDVRFSTADGLTLAGTYLSHRADRRLGVIVFSHEFLGDRWSVLPYLDQLRDQGFDLFSFDYRSHGQSDHDPRYKPLQWVTNHEVNDLRAALAYVGGRPDADRAGVGLFGVSRGGGTALCVAGKEARVWGVATDSAFPTGGMMLAYITRWAGIYVSSSVVWRNMPMAVYHFLGWSARKRSQRRLNCRYPAVERAIARLAPRPLFMIHGGKDGYIGPVIAENLYKLGGSPKEFWLVPKAKHNGCRQAAGHVYHERIADFFLANAPRAASSTKPLRVTVEIGATSTVPGPTVAALSSAPVTASALSH